MAKAFPKSRFFGFDYHAPSIERARQGGRGGRCRRPRQLRGGARPRTFPAGTTISSPSSIACTTWAIRSAPRRMCAQTLAPDGTWLHRRALRARPARGQSQSGRADLLRRLDHDLHAGVAQPGGRRSASALRPARRGCAMSSRAAASLASAARPRRRSTWSWKRGLSADHSAHPMTGENK